MEIKTCEEYVLKELEKVREELYLIKKENEELRKKARDDNKKVFAYNIINNEIFKLGIKEDLESVIQECADIKASLQDEIDTGKRKITIFFVGR